MVDRSPRETNTVPQGDLDLSAVRRLRSTTRSFHDVTDAAFSVFDLGDLDDYTLFLMAHARATSAAENELSGDATLPAWRPRAPLLADDLDSLGMPMPPPLVFKAPTDEAGRWGVLYVLEGSRLGGSVLLKRTATGAPTAFLSARHLSGEWRSLLGQIEARNEAMGAAWIDDAIAGACACFELYREAAIRPGRDASEPGLDRQPTRA